MTNSFTPLLGIYKYTERALTSRAGSTAAPAANAPTTSIPRSCDNIVPAMPSSTNASLDVPEHNKNQSHDPKVMEMALYHKIGQRNARRNKRGDGPASDMNAESVD
jgi:hypothetical protein